MLPDEEEHASRAFRPSLAELEALHALIVTGKTTAAAERLGITQPAVSRAVASLQGRLGCELFTRDGGRLVPTRHAFALDAEATPILAAMSRLEGWPDAPPAAATLRIMAPPTIAQTFLALVVPSFRRAEPSTRIHMEIGRAADTVFAVAEGSADLGLVDTPASHAGVRSEMLRRTVAHVLLPAEHPLAGRHAVTALDLAEEPLVAVTRRFSARARLERAFAEHGLSPLVVLEAATVEFLVEMVRSGAGLAVVNPFPISSTIGSELVLRRFEPVIPHEVAFLFSANGGRDDAARRFSEFARTERPFLEAVDH
jgi:DNA-binding transcriptional LysR family regulator